MTIDKKERQNREAAGTNDGASALPGENFLRSVEPRDHELEIRLMRLTGRQRELLTLIAQGFESSKALSQIVEISPGTIDNHISKAVQILGASSRKDAARIYAASINSAVKVREGGPLPSSVQVAEPAPTSLWMRLVKVLRGPALGGAEPPSSWTNITFHILWVAFVGMVALMALTLFVLAFFQTFG